jgi:hypothetical protein
MIVSKILRVRAAIDRTPPYKWRRRQKLRRMMRSLLALLESTAA